MIRGSLYCALCRMKVLVHGEVLPTECPCGSRQFISTAPPRDQLVLTTPDRRFLQELRIKAE